MSTIAENMKKRAAAIQQTKLRNERLDAEAAATKAYDDERRGYAIDAAPEGQDFYGKDWNKAQAWTKAAAAGDQQAANDLNILNRLKNDRWKRGQSARDAEAGIVRTVSQNPFRAGNAHAYGQEGSDAHLWDINNGKTEAAKRYYTPERMQSNSNPNGLQLGTQFNPNGAPNDPYADTSGLFDTVTPQNFNEWKKAQSSKKTHEEAVQQSWIDAASSDTTGMFDAEVLKWAENNPAATGAQQVINQAAQQQTTITDGEGTPVESSFNMSYDEAYGLMQKQASLWHEGTPESSKARMENQKIIGTPEFVNMLGNSMLEGGFADPQTWYNATNVLFLNDPEAYMDWAATNPSMAVKFHAMAAASNNSQYTGWGVGADTMDWTSEKHQQYADLFGSIHATELGFGEDGKMDGRMVATNYNGDISKDVNNVWGGGDWTKMGTPQKITDGVGNMIKDNPVGAIALAGAIAFAPQLAGYVSGLAGGGVAGTIAGAGAAGAAIGGGGAAFQDQGDIAGILEGALKGGLTAAATAGVSEFLGGSEFLNGFGDYKDLAAAGITDAAGEALNGGDAAAIFFAGATGAAKVQLNEGSGIISDIADATDTTLWDGAAESLTVIAFDTLKNGGDVEQAIMQEALAQGVSLGQDFIGDVIAGVTPVGEEWAAGGDTPNYNNEPEHIIGADGLTEIDISEIPPRREGINTVVSHPDQSFVDLEGNITTVAALHPNHPDYVEPPYLTIDDLEPITVPLIRPKFDKNGALVGSASQLGELGTDALGDEKFKLHTQQRLGIDTDVTGYTDEDRWEMMHGEAFKRQQPYSLNALEHNALLDASMVMTNAVAAQEPDGLELPSAEVEQVSHEIANEYNVDWSPAMPKIVLEVEQLVEDIDIGGGGASSNGSLSFIDKPALDNLVKTYTDNIVNDIFSDTTSNSISEGDVESVVLGALLRNGVGVEGITTDGQAGAARGDIAGDNGTGSTVDGVSPANGSGVPSGDGGVAGGAVSGNNGQGGNTSAPNAGGERYQEVGMRGVGKDGDWSNMQFFTRNQQRQFFSANPGSYEQMLNDTGREDYGLMDTGSAGSGSGGQGNGTGGTGFTGSNNSDGLFNNTSTGGSGGGSGGGNGTGNGTGNGAGDGLGSASAIIGNGTVASHPGNLFDYTKLSPSAAAILGPMIDHLENLR